MKRNLSSLLASILLASACSGAPESTDVATEVPAASSEQALSCTNWSTRTAGYPSNPIGCCNRTTMRYRSEICIYGTWYSNGSVCTQNTSYCSLCGPNATSCGG